MASINECKFKVINSPIRWAGSKKQLISSIFRFFPSDKHIYIEPFLGSGTVLINVLLNKDLFSFDKYYVNDVNTNVIFFFKQLKKFKNKLLNNIEKEINIYNALSFVEKEKYYYNLRNYFNKPNLNAIDKATTFYLLTRTCFNGVYRENSKGEYNVPFGKKEKIFFPRSSLEELSKQIKNVTFFSLDYKDFLKKVEKDINFEDSFIYCDPPYIPDDDSVYQIQTLYSKDRFNHNEFASFIMNYNNSLICISMSDSNKADEIYFGLIKETILDVKRIVNPKINKPSKEVIFLNK